MHAMPKIKQKWLTLFGCLSIKIGTGIISMWTTTNIYYLSYFKWHGENVTQNTNSIILISIVIPICIFILIANYLSRKFGHINVIRFCAIIFLISPIGAYFHMSIVTTFFFIFFLPISCFAISSIPLLNSVWSHFPDIKNKISGLIILFFTLGSILWNLTFMYIVNPNNQKAIIKQGQLAYFSKSISQQVLKATKIVYSISGILFVIGSLFITRQHALADSNLSNLKYTNNSDNSPQQLTPKKIISINQQIIKKQNNNNNNNNQIISSKKSLKSVLIDSRFIAIFITSFCTSLYQIYLLSNLKIIYLPIINDDHYLAYCILTFTAFSILGALIWGIVGDFLGFSKCLLLLTFLDLGFKFYGLFATQKWSLMLMFILLGFIDKGFLTIVGPGLIDIFGFYLGTELLPFKGISLMLGFALVPILQLMTSKWLNAHQILIVLFIFSGIAFGTALWFWNKNRFKSNLNEEQDNRGQQIQIPNYQDAFQQQNQPIDANLIKKQTMS